MTNLRTIFSTQVSRYLTLRRHGAELRSIIDRTRSIRKSDILLVMCLRNELARLPFFCDYYRKLGVNHFLIVDNDSSDGLHDWARAQADISLWHTRASYKQSQFGMEWCNFLLNKYGIGHLCVTVDPDEFLVYPWMETRDLRDLGEYMRMEKRDAFHAIMLDAYSDKPLNETVYHPGDNPFDACPYFDRDGYVQISTPIMPTFTRGGPRMRVHNRLAPEKSPALNKIPVAWWDWNFRYVSSMHDLKPMRLMRVQDAYNPAITGALFHFKFFASLADKAQEEMHRKQHFAGSAEYQQYAAARDPILYEDGISVRYESVEQLISLGLVCRGNWL
ncbi:MAG: hypothetical protein JWM58_4063 [Rhizobium sp.]|nr:hypothetical protein [Rhizobium sp.]